MSFWYKQDMEIYYCRAPLPVQFSPLTVPYLSLTCPLPVPYLSLTSPLPIPYFYTIELDPIEIRLVLNLFFILGHALDVSINYICNSLMPSLSSLASHKN